MKKRVNKWIGVAMTVALVNGLMIAVPVMPTKALTNYEKEYEYEFETLNVGDTDTIAITNPSDVVGYNESYVAKGENSELDADQLQKMIDKTEYDILKAQADRYGTDAFSYQGELIFVIAMEML